MTKLTEFTEEQLDRAVARQNRRGRRQQLQREIVPMLNGYTLWGKMARPSQIRAGAKLLAARMVAFERRNPAAAAV